MLTGYVRLPSLNFWPPRNPAKVYVLPVRSLKPACSQQGPRQESHSNLPRRPEGSNALFRNMEMNVVHILKRTP